MSNTIRTYPLFLRSLHEGSNAPLITALSYSGGSQSEALARMVLRGDIPKPPNFVMINADPGMERAETYKFVEAMRRDCAAQGIPFITAPGPNLYLDGLNNASKTHFNTPAFWTDQGGGKRGQIRQKCTQQYKIRPMDRVVRQLLHEWHGIARETKRIGVNIVEKWIGYSADEEHRIKPSLQKYIYFRFPLIEHGLTKADVKSYYARNNLPEPPRSVCVGCWANGTTMLRDMEQNSPEDWEKAVSFDSACRNLEHVGVKRPCYVSRTLQPLTDLANGNADFENGDDYACDSGHCFL